MVYIDLYILLASIAVAFPVLSHRLKWITRRHSQFKIYYVWQTPTPLARSTCKWCYHEEPLLNAWRYCRKYFSKDRCPIKISRLWPKPFLIIGLFLITPWQSREMFVLWPTPLVQLDGLFWKSWGLATQDLWSSQLSLSDSFNKGFSFTYLTLIGLGFGDHGPKVHSRSWGLSSL